MNPIMILFVLIFVILIWFLLSPVFEALGKVIYKVWNNARENMNKEEKEESEETKE